MIWREMINKSCVIWCCANIKKDVAGGSAVLQERAEPQVPEGKAMLALKILKVWLFCLQGYEIRGENNMKTNVKFGKDNYQNWRKGFYDENK